MKIKIPFRKAKTIEQFLNKKQEELEKQATNLLDAGINDTRYQMAQTDLVIELREAITKGEMEVQIS